MFDLTLATSFSPVAGIQWVETRLLESAQVEIECFSPVAGIQWVETEALLQRCNPIAVVSVPLPGFSGLRLFNPFQLLGVNLVSVPLPGFSGLRLVVNGGSVDLVLSFQSRCRDSVG